MHIQFSNISITVHKREFPESKDFWDGNWLHVTIIYKDDHTTVKVHGPYLHLTELSKFLKDCERLDKTLHGNAVLDPMEPNLKIELKAKKRGNIQMMTSITPNVLTQKHEILDEIDQSYLPDFITNLRQVLDEYPIQKESLLNKILRKLSINQHPLDFNGNLM